MKSAGRQSYWDALDNYNAEIVSLYHRAGANAVREALHTCLSPGARAADFGCGPGYWLPALAPAAAIAAVDWSANMLAQARANAPAQTVFHHVGLDDVALDAPVDVALCLNALMPESHGHARDLLCNLGRQMAAGGALIVVLPAMESRFYVWNMAHAHAAWAGKERKSLVRLIRTFPKTFNNPLGYVKSGNHQVVKFWIAEEFEATVTRLLAPTDLRRFKVPVAWTDFVAAADWQAGLEPPWFWGWTIQF